MLNRVSDVRIFGKGPESYVWRVGYGYAAAIREGAEEIPVIFLGLFSNTSGVAASNMGMQLLSTKSGALLF